MWNNNGLKAEKSKNFSSCGTSKELYFQLQKQAQKTHSCKSLRSRWSRCDEQIDKKASQSCESAKTSETYE